MGDTSAEAPPAPEPAPALPLPLPADAPPAPPVYYAPPAPVVLPPHGSPAELPFDGRAVPVGYHVRQRPQTGLIVGGAVTFGGVYLGSVVVGAMAGVLSTATSAVGCALDDAFDDGSPKMACDALRDDYRPLYIPLAGPWITIHTAHANAAGGVGLAALGLGQAAGVAMLVTGLATRGSKLVRNDLATPGVTVVPTTSAGGGGLALVGRF